MIRSLYTAVSGMISLEAKQDVITNNLTNATTNGYKSDNLAFKSFKDVLISNHDKQVGNRNVKNTIGNLSRGCKIDSVDTSFTQGVIKDTEKKTDFAIEGRGFFIVDNNGKKCYTRDGNFRTNTNGQLVNNEGLLVMSQNMQPIEVGSGKISADVTGNIFVDGNQRGKIAVADFENYNQLKKIGNNMYEGDGARIAANPVVRQGALEKSNVNTAKEMMDMITNMRSFETNQKVVQSIDETLGKAVNEVGRV